MPARDRAAEQRARRPRRAPAARLPVRAARSVSSRSTPRRRAQRATVSTLAPTARHASTAPAGAAAVVTTSVGASSVSNSGPVAGTRPAGVEQDARRLVPRRGFDVAHGELRPVGERGARTDHDRLRVGAQLVRVGAGGLGRRDPLRRAVGRRDASVEARRDLGDDERPAGAPVMEVRREVPGSCSLRRRRRSLRCPRRAAARDPRPRRVGSGSSSATTTRATPASISASAHGGVRP